MNPNHLILVFALFLVGHKIVQCGPSGPRFGENYKITFGTDHASISNHGRELHLFLDQSSGSGFLSKKSYGSGFFHLNMKLPGKNSAGVVTAFYLASRTTTHHDELDFEFLGNNDGKPHLLQTNVIANGIGDREQRIQLWFDPTKTYHSYRILWNLHQIVFFVDKYPIRVFRNTRRKTGVAYPAQPLQVVSSIWNGDSWATDGGRTKINWTYSPFMAGFRSFGIQGCPSDNNIAACSSTKLWWNRPNYWNLNPKQKTDYQYVRGKYLIYDYCSDRQRYPTPPPECSQPISNNISYSDLTEFGSKHDQKNKLNGNENGSTATEKRD